MQAFFITNRKVTSRNSVAGVWVYNNSKEDALFASGKKYAYTADEIEEIKRG